MRYGELRVLRETPGTAPEVPVVSFGMCQRRSPDGPMIALNARRRIPAAAVDRPRFRELVAR